MSPANNRRQLYSGTSRGKSSYSRKPPEPLRRAVADSLSSTLIHVHGSPLNVVSESSRTLRDYLSNPTTTDLAYNIILEYTLSERERSPAVVARCVALLRRFLTRYKPSEETFMQMDRFCVSIISECHSGVNRGLPLYTQNTDEQSGMYSSSTSASVAPIFSFSSEEVLGGMGSISTIRGLPTLSSLLNRSFKAQPVLTHEAYFLKEVSSTSQLSRIDHLEKHSGIKENDYFPMDVLRLRWLGKHQLSNFLNSNGGFTAPHSSYRDLLEVSAAALLVGGAEARMTSQPQNIFGTADFTYLREILNSCSVTAPASNSSSTRCHLRAITAAKRNKHGPHKIWDDSFMSTYRPLAKQLFQYKYYSEQLPLRLNNVEVREVISAVCSENISKSAHTSFGLNEGSGKPPIDVAVSVLVKLIIDMYVLDREVAAPLTLSMLERMATSSKSIIRARAFDIVMNLGVHGHLLEPIIADDTSVVHGKFGHALYFGSKAQYSSHIGSLGRIKMPSSSATDKFELWILGILCEMLLLLVQEEETEESVWVSALSCLFYFVCDRGRIRSTRLIGLDIRVVKIILEISRKNNWAAEVHSKLISMLVNMLYHVSSESLVSKCLLEQVELVGGIHFIFVEYSVANSREDRENLYVAVFDYLLCGINGFQLNNEGHEFDEGEIKVLACLLSLVEAPEIIHVFVKLGLEGVGKILQHSISFSLDRHPNGVRLNMLLELFVLKLELVVYEFTHVGKEFAPLVHVTKTCRCFKDVVGLKAETGKLAWSTLHCLLNSEMISCRHSAQIWLVDLLVAEVFNTGRSTQDNITTLKQQIYTVGVQDSVGASDIYLSVWLFCGLLKSRDHVIRQGFLFVLEKLLIRCKLHLDDDKFKIISEEAGPGSDYAALHKANAIIDIMSCALSLLAQVNETHHLIILKMCDVLFSQVCVRNPQWSRVSPDDTESAGSVDSVGAAPDHSASSMAVLLLQGQAVVPVQLVSRIPAALFYWPLIQLASAATDNISLGVAVGSQGRGNVPGATSDIRAALLLLLIGKCGADPTAYQEVEGEGFFRELLDDTDSRVAYYSSAFLLKQMMAEEPEKYKRILQSLVFRAQQSNNEKLLENPYLQMRGILQLSNDMITRKA